MTHSGYKVSSPVITNNQRAYPVVYADEIGGFITVGMKQQLAQLPQCMFVPGQCQGMLAYVIGENKYYKFMSNYPDTTLTAWQEVMPSITESEINEICI